MNRLTFHVQVAHSAVVMAAAYCRFTNKLVSMFMVSINLDVIMFDLSFW